MIDEPLVAPVSVGAAIVRLAQMSGALRRHPTIAQALPPDTYERLQAARHSLLAALEAGDMAGVPAAFHHAQTSIRQVYTTMCQPGLWPAEEAAACYAALGFPDPLQQAVQAVDPHTVLATFSKPERQVLTTLSFQDAAGATAYWLREVRVLDGHRLQDHMVEANAPVFTRLRLSVGSHVFRIETRNASEFTVSAEFSIEVPEL